MVYERYSNFVASICDSDLLGFKSNPDYTYMLEHVMRDYGEDYLKCILASTNIKIQDIQEFCKLNDSVGDPNKEKYDGLDIPVSPTSLRYILHADLILTHMKEVCDVNADVIELGGGYGGLCLAMHHFAPKHAVCIKSYTICDLPSIIRLQKNFLKRVSPSLTVEFIDACGHGSEIAETNLFLISNYCFSEISEENRNSYQKILFPKVRHGFMAWNHIPVYDFGFHARTCPEIPIFENTLNKLVYF